MDLLLKNKLAILHLNNLIFFLYFNISIFIFNILKFACFNRLKIRSIVFYKFFKNLFGKKLALFTVCKKFAKKIDFFLFKITLFIAGKFLYKKKLILDIKGFNIFWLKNFIKLDNYILNRYSGYNKLFDYSYARIFLKYNFKIEKKIFKKINKKLLLKNRFLRYNFNISNKVWGFWVNTYFKSYKFKKNYNLLFYSIIFKMKPLISLTELGGRIDFFKSFLKIKRYFSRYIRKNKSTYYCTIKKKKNNTYVSLFNMFGELVRAYSANRLTYEFKLKKRKRYFIAMKKIFQEIITFLNNKSFVKELIFIINKEEFQKLSFKRYFAKKGGNLFRSRFFFISKKPHSNILHDYKKKKSPRK